LGCEVAYDAHSLTTPVVKVDFYNDVKAYLSELGDSSPIKSVEDIIAYNIDSTGTEGGIPGTVPGFAAGQERFHESAATKGIEDETYRSALNFTQSTSRRGIDGALDHPDGAIDALLVPTGFQQAGMIAAQAGYPLVSLPAGVNSTRTGMPFGLMLMGTAWSEARLIELASAIEVVVRGEKGPRPLPEWSDYRRRVVPVLDE
jgi:amidase